MTDADGYRIVLSKWTVSRGHPVPNPESYDTDKFCVFRVNSALHTYYEVKPERYSTRGVAEAIARDLNREQP